jgi:PAS domain S-box-containing protein
MENVNSLLSIADVVKEITTHKDKISSLFELKLNDKITLPQDIKTTDFVTVIPELLDHIIQTLIKCSASGNSVNTLVYEPAIFRKNEKKFPLEILISEFIILKDVIFEILESKSRIETKASNLIWQYIVSAIKVSVAEYERERQVESDKMNLRLDKADTINEAISAQIIISHENEERYKTLVEGLDDYAVFTVNPKGVITSWNPGAARMKGYTSEEVIGRHFSLLYPELGVQKHEPMDHLHTALIEGRFRGEGMRRRKNGELFLADVYIRPIYKDGKHLGFAKVVADVTERNKLIQATNVSKAVIGDLNSEKEQRQNFVMTLTHDLRGPISIVRAAAELLKRHMDPSDKLQKLVDKILHSIDRTNNMIGDLLDANRITAGEELTLKIHDWDLVRLMKNVCDDFQTLGNKVDLHTKQQELTGRWDGEGLRRILENLISNAVKYGDTSYPVDVTLMDLGENICIIVHNMGEVIAPSDQISLFDQFRRTPSAIKNKKGWGIGLSLVKGITEAHGGTVEVESFPLEGTNFKVNLPKFTRQDPMSSVKQS